MMRRVTWFTSGLVAGAASTVYATHKIKQKAEALKPVNVARSAVNRAKDRVHDLTEAIREGREAMRDKEAELQALRDGELAGAEVVPVQPGQVIVLRSPGAAGGPTRRRA